MRSPVSLLHLLAVLLILPACKTGQVNNVKAGNYCAPSMAVTYDAQTIPFRNTDSLLAAYPSMPAHEVLMANAIGVLSMVYQLEQNHDSSVTGRLQKNELRYQIQHRAQLASSDIAGAAAELDCEGEQADQLGRYLDEMNSKRNTRLTAASIITGAITTIATVAIKNTGTQNAVAISGGLLSAALGALTINPAGKKMNVIHQRNLLADIWYKPAVSLVYSPFIWYVLNEKRFSYSGKASLTENIKKRWIEFDLGKTISSPKEKLFFAQGGLYKANELHTRAAMLNELQSTVRSINQDLQSLLEYVGRIH